MAGTLTIDTLKDSAGNSTSSTNCIRGSAKAWVNFAGATGTVNQSFNVSSVTRTTTGNYQINFTTAFSNANYSIMGMTDPSNAQRTTISCYSPSQANTASQAFVVTWNNAGAGFDCASVYIAAFGA
jgi:predicted CxxxxCH...CXXCH cytochrome family protein